MFTSPVSPLIYRPTAETTLSVMSPGKRVGGEGGGVVGVGGGSKGRPTAWEKWSRETMAVCSVMTTQLSPRRPSVHFLTGWTNTWAR